MLPRPGMDCTGRRLSQGGAKGDAQIPAASGRILHTPSAGSGDPAYRNDVRREAGRVPSRGAPFWLRLGRAGLLAFCCVGKERRKAACRGGRFLVQSPAFGKKTDVGTKPTNDSAGFGRCAQRNRHFQSEDCAGPLRKWGCRTRFWGSTPVPETERESSRLSSSAWPSAQ